MYIICYQIYYFRRVIGEISSVRMWSSILSLPYSKSNVRHEETVLVSSMLFQISDSVKTFKILFSQFKSVSRFINVWQTCFQTMLKRRVQLQNSGPIKQELVVSDTGCANSMRKYFRTQTSICRTLFVDLSKVQVVFHYRIFMYVSGL